MLIQKSHSQSRHDTKFKLAKVRLFEEPNRQNKFRNEIQARFNCYQIVVFRPDFRMTDIVSQVLDGT